MERMMCCRVEAADILSVVVNCYELLRPVLTCWA
jgi:hypothetical protein